VKVPACSFLAAKNLWLSLGSPIRIELSIHQKKKRGVDPDDIIHLGLWLASHKLIKRKTRLF
jgi:hypothetical protein